MNKTRIKIEVEVNLDPIPGWGHRPSDYVEHIQRLLDQTIPHYDPQVMYVSKVEKVTSDVAS
jgi:hypothetical protein